MSEKIQQSIADSLEADALLLPHMPFLLQDLWALGSSVPIIIEALQGLQLRPERTRVLDLGCGKGAVSVQIADKLGFRVLGIDAEPSFLKQAEQQAQKHQVAHLCEFRKQDIHQFIAEDHDFDVVLLASLGGILGDFTETMAKLRRQVRSDGYILIDDGYLKQCERLDRKGYGHYRSLEVTQRELTAHGDQIIYQTSTSAISKEINDEYLRLICARGKELAALKPEIQIQLDAYIALQAEECQVIDRDIEGTLWLIQKKESRSA